MTELPAMEQIQEQIVESIKEGPQERVQQHTVGNVRAPVPTVWEQLIVQETPGVQVVERIQKQIAGTLPQERVQQRTVEQNMCMSVPTVQEKMNVQGIPRVQVGERIQEQIAETISQESVQQCTGEQIEAVSASSAATASPSTPVSVIEHATLAPVDVYTKTAPVVDLMPAPVIQYIAPSAAVSYPSFFPSFDQIHESLINSADATKLTALVQNSQISDDAEDIIAAGAPAATVYKNHSGSIVETLEDLKSKAESQLVEARQTEATASRNFQMLQQSLEDEMKFNAQDLEASKSALTETQGQLTTDSADLKMTKETVQQRTVEQIAAPCAATASHAPPMSMIGHAMPTPVDVYTKTAPVIEPMVAPVFEHFAPCPAVSYPSAFSSDIPRVQVVKRIRGKRAHQRTVEQNVRAPVPMQEQRFVPEKPGAQGEEEAYWNEYVDQMGSEQMHQDWLLDQMAEQMHQESKLSKKKKHKNLDRTGQVMERIPEHTVVSFDQEEKLNNIKI